MKYPLFLLFFILLFHFSEGQGYGNKWVIGTPNVLVTFSADTVQLDYFDSKPNYCDRYLQNETDCICDTGGNMEFYYNGMNIISYKKYGIMDNGDSLDCCLNQSTNICASTYPNASMILPDLYNNDLYNVFQINIDTTAFGYPLCTKLLQHRVNMSMNNGEGKVVSKNELIYDKPFLLPRLAAVKHGNGKDWWLIGHNLDGNTFYTWLVKDSTVSNPLIQSTGSEVTWQTYGKTTFSPDGSMIAMFTGDDTLDVFSFDRCTGRFSNAREIYIDDSLPPGATVGSSCCFSASGRLLYTSGIVGKIRQFDMTIPNLDSAYEVIGNYEFGHACYVDTPAIENGFGDMQLGPDGKIYISDYQGSPCMHIINYPNVKGLSCGFVQDAFQLYPNVIPSELSSLPNQPNYKLGPFIGSACDTINGLENVKLKSDDVSVFPNPSNDLINIKVLNGAIPDNISIMDVTGRIWEQFKPHLSNSQLNIAPLPQGVYFLQVKMATRVFVSKVVKE